MHPVPNHVSTRQRLSIALFGATIALSIFGMTPAAIAQIYSEGDRGYPIGEIQSALRRENYFLTVDAVFGPETRVIVQNFQRRVGLTADGVVGPATLRALGLSNLTDGSSGGDNEAEGDRFYVVIIPSNQSEALATTRRTGFNNACFVPSGLGEYIEAVARSDVYLAESDASRLRNANLDARVEYLRPRCFNTQFSDLPYLG